MPVVLPARPGAGGQDRGAGVPRGTRAGSTRPAQDSGCRAPTLTEPSGATHSRRRRSILAC